MSQTLTELAQQLITSTTIKKEIKRKKEFEESKHVPKVQLIYAFNGSGKTRLSQEVKNLIGPKDEEDERDNETWPKVLYYNALTEDLFYWDNDLENDFNIKLKIQPNSYTDWILKKQGKEPDITALFQKFTNDKLTPTFNDEYKTKDKDGKVITIPAFSEVTFSFERGDDSKLDNIKISKGEESNFIWSIFYTLLEEIISSLTDTDLETGLYDQIEYVFIDDPVTSLDENHLIELAVNLSGLIKSAPSNLKFIITTHSPLFYNVLYSELNNKTCYLLERFEDGTFALNQKEGDSNKSFSYHLYLKQLLEKAVADNQIEKYHFTLLRNLYEKTCGFLGYDKWADLLPGDEATRKAYLKRIITFTSHSTLSNESVAEPTQEEKKIVQFLLKHLHENYSYCPKPDEKKHA